MYNSVLQEVKEITPNKLAWWFLMLLMVGANGYVVKSFPMSVGVGVT